MENLLISLDMILIIMSNDTINEIMLVLNITYQAWVTSSYSFSSIQRIILIDFKIFWMRFLLSVNVNLMTVRDKWISFVSIVLYFVHNILLFLYCVIISKNLMTWLNWHSLIKHIWTCYSAWLLMAIMSCWPPQWLKW